jgi:hypothetical protein
MKSIEQLARKIEELRTNLDAVIKEGKELTSPEVIKASKSLDKVLNQYYRMLGIKGFRIIEEKAE